MDRFFYKLIPVLLLAVVANILFVAEATAQDEQETGKSLLEAIAGDYIFSVQGQKSVITFLVKEGSLYAYDQDDGETVRLEPVDLEKLEFETVNTENVYFFLKFFRSEEGEVNRMIISTDGMDIEGEKIK